MVTGLQFNFEDMVSGLQFNFAVTVSELKRKNKKNHFSG